MVKAIRLLSRVVQREIQLEVRNYSKASGRTHYSLTISKELALMSIPSPSQLRKAIPISKIATLFTFFTSRNISNTTTTAYNSVCEIP